MSTSIPRALPASIQLASSSKPRQPPLRAGQRRARLVDPGPGMLAVNADGRIIDDAAERRGGRDRRGEPVERPAARPARRNRDDDRLRPVERLPEPGPGAARRRTHARRRPGRGARRRALPTALCRSPRSQACGGSAPPRNSRRRRRRLSRVRPERSNARTIRRLSPKGACPDPDARLAPGLQSPPPARFIANRPGSRVQTQSVDWFPRIAEVADRGLGRLSLWESRSLYLTFRMAAEPRGRPLPSDRKRRHESSASSSVLASRRSSVSKPSVNQP